MILRTSKHLNKEYLYKDNKEVNAVKTAFLGGLLILTNTILMAVNGSPIIISTAKPSPIEVLLSDAAPLWFRVAFGVDDCSRGTTLIIGILMALTILFGVPILYFKPQHRKLLSIIILSLVIIMLLYGGGFIIGFLLTFIGVGILYETQKKSSGTFFGSILKVLRADKGFFINIDKMVSIRDAVKVTLLVNLLSGVGTGVYIFNVQKILNASVSQIPLEILINGKIYFDITVASTPIMLMGLGIIKWIILSLIFFAIMKLFKWKANLEKVAICIGFAQTPIALQLFTPFVFTSKPYLATIWPLLMFLISNLWMVVLIIYGLKNSLDISVNKSIEMVALSLSIYVFVIHWISSRIEIPYTFTFQIEPQGVFLSLISFIILMSALMLSFSKED